MSARVRLAAAACAFAALTLDAGAARADKPIEGLLIEAMPTVGTGATLFEGWTELSVRLQNDTATASRGEVEITSNAPYSETLAFRATAPYAVAAGSSAVVRVPCSAQSYAEIAIKVRDDSGVVRFSRELSPATAAVMFLLDVDDPSLVRGAVNEVDVVPQYVPSSRGGASGSMTLLVAPSRFDRATGDPVLPLRASGYASAAAVIMRSDTLARLAGAELDALAGYVLAGGTLALAVTRPEDLRSPALTAMIGGEAVTTRAPPQVMRELVLPSASSSRPAREIPYARSPADAVSPTLAGYSGGNLHGSLYGSSAYYGLGEVHLLAFDPTRRPAADDPWAQARVVDLTRRGYDRRSSLVFGHGAAFAGYDGGAIRRTLDPNESSRWAIGAAAVLLCIYAIVAGPLSFARASRRGKPLRALLWLPLFAAVAFGLVVAVGAVAKGLHGRARHLTLVEAGAGMGTGTARRFRGFYTSRAEELTVRATDARSVLGRTGSGDADDASTHLFVDRDGVRLVDSAALPWETVVIREDGFADLGDGIAITGSSGADTWIANRTGRDMRAVILKLPGRSPIYFPSLRDGEKVSARGGHILEGTPDEADYSSAIEASRRTGATNANPIAAYMLRPIVEIDAPGLTAAWGALEQAAGDAVDWFPDDVPVVLAQLDGGEGHASDSGLRLESDRLLVRVVGYGGKP